MNKKNKLQPIYFGGQLEKEHKEPKWTAYEKWIHTEEAFLMYIVQVWAKQNDAPTEFPKLAKFDFQMLYPDYDEWLKSGGDFERRGNTVEEQWMLGQLTLATPHICLLNSSQPQQPVSRITRLKKLSAEEIWHKLEKRYAGTIPEQPSVEPIILMVYDGVKVAHQVVSYLIWGNELHYQDPWPGRSLLCRENNMAGVNARKSNIIQHGWRITDEEFQNVIFAVILTQKKLVELTEEEQQAAKNDSLIMGLLRSANKSHSSSIKDIYPGAKSINELEFAVKVGQTWRIKLALNKGYNINKKFPDGTPLHIAAAGGHLNIVKLLIEQGADISALDSKGKTPEKVAANNRYPEIAKYLRTLKKRSENKK